MIIETREDVVRLSGSLHKNQWMTIKAAANLLIHNYPQGIIIDCGELDNISQDGAKTFLEAIRDIEAAHARIIVTNLPENVLSVVKSIPGIRSQLPIAASVEEARASLRAARRSTPAPTANAPGKGGSVILVPLVSNLDLTYGAQLAARLARPGKSEIRLIYLLEVARNLPLNAPLMEPEQAAQTALEAALQYTRQYNIPTWPHVERVREANDGIIAAVKTHAADLIVMGAADEPLGGEGHDDFHAMVDTLLHRAPCEVVVGRLKPPV